MKHTKRNSKGQFAKHLTMPFWVPFAVTLALIFSGQVYALANSNTEYYEKFEVTEITLIETTADSSNVQYHDMAVQVAINHNLDVQLFTSTIACESNFNPTIQSNHRYNFNDPSRGIVKGEQERSYGIVQIHIPDHDITIEQAQDPVFALNWMAEKWANGYPHLWSCYRHIVGS